MRYLMFGSMVSLLFVGCGGVSDPNDPNLMEPVPQGDECLVGSSECACTVGGVCDPGLSCNNNVCVRGGEDGGTGGQPGTGGAVSTGGALITGGSPSMGGTTNIGGQGGAESADIPWEVTAILVNDGLHNKKLVVWTESTHGCQNPTGIATCSPYRDHTKLSIPITAEQFMVGSFAIGGNAFSSEQGPNSTDPDDCWGGGGTLSGNVQIKSIAASSMVVTLSNLFHISSETSPLLNDVDIHVTMCE